ncbi:MAG TPA: tyrosine-type recombinase/integrase [Candidatus Hodarchaeales archaeon]|nr:tyrosine-type recombinase/integrase [Candidatus Hodarchaeales archaeon]
MNINDMIQECIKQLKSKKSDNTVRTYNDGFEVFAEYVVDQELTPQHFIDFPAYLIQKYENKRTAQNRDAAVSYLRMWLTHKRYLKWDEQNQADYTFAKKDAFSEREFNKPKVSKEEYITASLEVVKTMKVFYSIERTRNEAILLLMYSAGIRVSEVAALNTDDVLLNEGKIFIKKAKGRKSFYSPISPAAVEAIRKYWEARNWTENSPPAFGRHDKQSSTNHLRYKSGGIQRMVDRLESAMGLPQGSVSPHKYRHSVGTRVTKQFGIHAAQRYLHHESIDTTKGYVHVTDEDLTDIANQMYPKPDTQTSGPSG